MRQLERAREEWETQNHLDGEIAEMIEIYIAKGMSRADATTVVGILAKDPRILVDTMMTEELGYTPFAPRIEESRKVLFVGTGSYVLAATLPYLVAPQYRVWLAMVEAALLGAIRARVSFGEYVEVRHFVGSTLLGVAMGGAVVIAARGLAKLVGGL